MTARPDTGQLSARLRHHIPGRIRLKLEGPLPNRSALNAIAEAMAGVEGVESVEIRISTSSLLIRYAGVFEPIAQRLANDGILRMLPEMPEPAFDPVGETAKKIAGAEALLIGATGGALDLRKAIFLGLIAAGFVQTARGRIAGPALTLFGQAASLMTAKGWQGGGER